MVGKVLGGYLEGSLIRYEGKSVRIEPSRKYNEDRIYLNPYSVENYTLVTAENKKNLGDALIGGMVFGPVGAIVGSGIAGTQYTLIIEYKDKKRKGKKSMIQLDSGLYKLFMASMM